MLRPKMPPKNILQNLYEWTNREYERKPAPIAVCERKAEEEAWL